MEILRCRYYGFSVLDTQERLLDLWDLGLALKNG